jgi:hypothetical protein
MHNIIVTVDFTPGSVNACRYAAQMAEMLQAKLMVLAVHQLPVSFAYASGQEIVKEEESVEGSLENLKMSLDRLTNSSVEIVTGNLVQSFDDELAEWCDNHKPIMVIMGMHEPSFMERMFVEDRALHHARNLKYPVLLVPPHVKFAKVSNMALASDLEDLGAVPQNEIAMFMHLFGSPLQVLHIAKTEEDLNNRATHNQLAEKAFEALKPGFHYCHAKTVKEGIEKLTGELNIDMLIVIPKHQGLFQKSHSREFIFRNPVPVMAIHPYDHYNQIIFN